MTPQSHIDTTYLDLRKTVERTLAEGIVRAEQAIFRERLRTYWEIGGVLQVYLERNGREYGDTTIKRLSGDVNLSQVVLYDALKLRRLLNIFPAQEILTWSHYRRLMSVTDVGD